MQQQQLSQLKQLEFAYKEGELKLELLDHICQDTILQLPFVLRSKILAEHGEFCLARNDCHKAHELNPKNKRGIVSEKLVSYLEELKLNRCSSAISDIRSQIMRACQDFCTRDAKSSLILKDIMQQNLPLLQKEDLECILCLDTFIDPVSTPCGHNYCRVCLVRSLDCSRQCPTCRVTIPPIGYFLNVKTNQFLQSCLDLLGLAKPVIPFAFPQIWIPIYFHSILFPNATMTIHICDPAHRVMIKRCIEGDKRFGMMLPQAPNNPIQYGTLVEITTFEPLLACDIVATCDGNLPRYVVHVKAISRFRVDQWDAKDGIHMGYVSRLEDEQQDPESLEGLVTKARSFVAELMRKIPPQARLYLERKHGVMPEDPSDFSFWLGSFLPLNPFVLYQLMPLTNVTSRMELLCKWLEEAISAQPN
jgi:Lon protease-like protein